VKLLEELNSAQQEAVRWTEGPILIVAGPGSGKTRCLTHKAAYLTKENLATPDEILLCTFTNKAGNEMKERLKKLLSQQPSIPWIGTFHAICARILRYDGKEIGISPNFTIYDDDDSKKIIKKLLAELRIPEKDARPGAVLGTIEGAKHELVSATDFQNFAHGYFQERVAKIYPKYQKTLAKNDALDFGDLISKTVKLFEQRPEILRRWQERFRYILVDEYQDTNRAQYTLVKALAKKHRNLCVVGDVSQAIYGWRGADFRNILNFQKDWPEAKVFRLEQNYRSTRKIIAAAKEVIEHNHTHIALSLWTKNSPGKKINVYQAANERDEAAYIVGKIKEGRSLNSYAILYRTNSQSRVLEEALIREGIPYQLVGGVRFYERREVKDILSYLRIIANPHDRLSLERIINTPPRRVGKKAQAGFRDRGWQVKDVATVFEFPLERLITQRDALPPLAIMDEILEKTGYLQWLDNRAEENLDRVENVKELRSVAAEFTTLKDFLQNVALVQNGHTPQGTTGKRQSAANKPAVTLITLHAAKGLEFPVVFIAGMEEGLFPHSRSMMDIHELEEERRLCYVGMTRAQKELYLTYAQKRLLFGDRSWREPSRFLAEIPEELLEITTSWRIFPKSTPLSDPLNGSYTNRKAPPEEDIFLRDELW